MLNLYDTNSGCEWYVCIHFSQKPIPPEANICWKQNCSTKPVIKERSIGATTVVSTSINVCHFLSLSVWWAQLVDRCITAGHERWNTPWIKMIISWYIIDTLLLGDLSNGTICISPLSEQYHKITQWSLLPAAAASQQLADTINTSGMCSITQSNSNTMHYNQGTRQKMHELMIQ